MLLVSEHMPRPDQEPLHETVPPQYRSRHFRAIWELATGMHTVGALTDAELAVYADACLVSPQPAADPRTSASAS